ncbi:MAG: terpene cyclase/mutase family protein [Planctomycetes bacterium]|nr:terpene cyclase/mutase family protein [Planctomycetota bacterium]
MTTDVNGNDEFVDGAEDGSEEEDDRRQGSGWAGWLISFTFHALLIGLMTTIYFLVKPPDVDVPPVRVATIEPPPKKEEKPKEERTLETTVELDVQADSDHPNPISQLDLPVENSEREEESDNPVAKGREEAVADSEMGGSGAFMAIGAGGGSSGMFGSRTGGGKKRAVGKFGGSKGSESAVDAALRWFKKHQSPNGMWDPVKYPANCTEDPKCEPGKYSNVGDAETTMAMTGYAVLCFLGAGYDHQTPNKYKAVVKKGLDYMISAQKADGSLGTHNYQNAIATMALAEAFAMTGDPALKTPAQNGVNTILARQNQDLAKAPAAAGTKDPYGGFGWDYSAPNGRSDSSVTGWNVMALKSALAAQLNIGNGMEGAKQWLEKVWKANNPDWAKLDPYKGESVFPYQYMSDQANGGAPGHQGLACVGAVCAVFLGHHAGDTMLESLCNTIMNKQTPAAYPCNTYYMYYNTLAIFQVGGERFKRWNTTVRDMLVNAQKKGNGCFDGSWDWEGTAFHGYDVGRVLSTAYCCLSLEVYYRYAQVAAADNKK